ncbi:MAG: hypothetical protein J7502_12450 [Flavisolibacter sp.]|nr:hypothetical protein [Flavisolibacter sp.]
MRQEVADGPVSGLGQRDPSTNRFCFQAFSFSKTRGTAPQHSGSYSSRSATIWQQNRHGHSRAAVPCSLVLLVCFWKANPSFGVAASFGAFSVRETPAQVPVEPTRWFGLRSGFDDAATNARPQPGDRNSGFLHWCRREKQLKRSFEPVLTGGGWL